MAANWWEAFPEADAQAAAAPAASPSTASVAASAPVASTADADSSQQGQQNWWDAYPEHSPAEQSLQTTQTPKAAPQVSGVGAVQNGLEDMLLFGGKDELFAGLDAAAQPLFGTGNEGETFSDRYNKNLVDQRDYINASEDQHPVLNAVGGVVGAVAPALLTGGASLAGNGARASLAATSAKSAGIGAAQGGAYGFGSADGDVSDRLSEAGTGALLGGAIGGAAPSVIGALSGAVRNATPTRLLPKPGPQPGAGIEAASATPPSAPAGGLSTAGESGLRDTAKSVVDAAMAPKRGADAALGDLAESIRPQQSIIDAADRLGVNGLTPAQYSGNQTFRNIEGALAALPGNDIAAQRADVLSKLSQRADDFINEFGGSTDKAGYSDAFKRSATQTIEGLKGQADDLYRYIGQQIPNTTRAPADNTIAYLQGKVAELGGAPLLNANERKALNILSPTYVTEPNPLIPGTVRTIVKNPTYGALDLVRKQIGQGYSRTGPFKDMQQGQLDALYSTLTRDQEALVNSVSPELASVYKGAKSVVAQRKELESSLQSVLGKDLSGSIATSLGSSVKQLGQGNFKNFDNIIRHIPEASRQDAIVTALNDAFTSGSAQRQLSADGFSKWWGDVSRQGAARDRFAKYLPDDAIKRLDDIATVAKGIADASKQTVRTGVSRGALEDYLGEGGVVSRIWDIAKPALVAEGLGNAAGVPGLGATIAVVAGMRKNAVPIQQRAADLLASPQLGNLLKSFAAAGGEPKANVLAREKQLIRTQAYRAWERALSESARARIATVGPLVYLTEQARKPGQIELPPTNVTP
ncbi:MULTISPECIES: hypothetical protein [unclassified Pseudomonas]|uniref:hypothetical protein n=1 Tax=unclassified Pseudomonas TaxID=196821 RepID=UPI000D356C72|nr:MULTISPECIES: hypothetical protein [unclassified Pseudomonas]RAU43693.1 hypothetical protein DBP26_019385 [Pseudomonas sp. RIT 409]RAU54375.1 hypothetical protein DBY65_008585 [Pseudomonas sp. RIT 412]